MSRYEQVRAGMLITSVLLRVLKAFLTRFPAQKFWKAKNLNKTNQRNSGHEAERATLIPFCGINHVKRAKKHCDEGFFRIRGNAIRKTAPTRKCRAAEIEFESRRKREKLGASQRRKFPWSRLDLDLSSRFVLTMTIDVDRLTWLTFSLCSCRQILKLCSIFDSRLPAEGFQLCWLGELCEKANICHQAEDTNCIPVRDSTMLLLVVGRSSPTATQSITALSSFRACVGLKVWKLRRNNNHFSRQQTLMIPMRLHCG